MKTFHVDDNGIVRPCVAQARECKYGIHGTSVENTQQQFDASMATETIAKTLSKKQEKLTAFTADAYYGKQSPRQVQLEALNAVAEALDEADATQLVAACGTGKSYMGRQLLNHEMMKPDANGISVILTSSIKLATDTAQDLRPSGNYDQALGIYGKDYEVIEVHSNVRLNEDVKQTVLDNGVISISRIQQQLAAAIAEGKKVVIVSTYDSASRVQEAQSLLNDDKYMADIIMHDEAHNILGQQKPTTVASGDNELTAYTGFHNDIPGAIKSKKRLYATASPVLRESPGDQDEPETLENAIEIAEKMKNGDQWARVTYYSDNEMVGKVSGFISQEAAIESGCLARPEYAVRESVLKGRLQDFENAAVNPDGTLVEAEASKARNPLNVRTYGAVKATLDALAADPDEGKNPASNVLAYVGSINQAEAFKEAFASVAKAEANNMSPLTAVGLVNSEDPVIRRQARMALLAANAEVKAAHSNTDSASVRERKEAFKMFKGKGIKPGDWTPDKRVLANVDIFSEGVSISEIDAVVISDDEKCSERNMTQAIGRAIRVLPNNNYKTTGHVIVPAVTDGAGVKVNEASVHLAAYGASRVERALVAKKLRGEGVRPDEKTTFAVYSSEGRRQSKLARDFAQESVSEIMPLVAATEAHSAHQYLMRTEADYRNASAHTQAEWVKSRISEKAQDVRLGERNQALLGQVSNYVSTKTAHQLREERRNARVVTSALAVGDVSSLSPTLVSSFIKNDVLTTSDKVAEITLAEKRAVVEKHAQAVRYAILTNPAGMSEAHRTLQNALPEPVRKNKNAQKDSMKLLRGQGGETEATQALGSAFSELLQTDDFVAAAYELSQEKDKAKLPIIDGPLWTNVKQDLLAQERAREDRQHSEALQGEQAYVINRENVRKSGELTSRTLRKLLAD